MDPDSTAPAIPGNQDVLIPDPSGSISAGVGQPVYTDDADLYVHGEVLTLHEVFGSDFVPSPKSPVRCLQSVSSSKDALRSALECRGDLVVADGFLHEAQAHLSKALVSPQLRDALGGVLGAVHSALENRTEVLQATSVRKLYHVLAAVQERPYLSVADADKLVDDLSDGGFLVTPSGLPPLMALFSESD